MDASALQSKLGSLENSWGSLDAWLNFWTILVVVGVAIELLVLIVEYTHEWHDFKRATIRSPEKPSLALFGVGFLGAALVAIGVAGEFRVHIQAGRVETDMRDATRKLVAISDGEAKSAVERAARLEQDNLTLRGQVAKLEAAGSWRDFTKAQRDKLILLTKRELVNAPMFTMSSDSVVGNPEAKRYGDQLTDALSSALGIMVANPSGLSTCLQCTGVWVCVNENASAPMQRDAKVIRLLLEQSGVKASKFCTDPKDGQGADTNIKIIVGPKE